MSHLIVYLVFILFKSFNNIVWTWKTIHVNTFLYTLDYPLYISLFNSNHITGLSLYCFNLDIAQSIGIHDIAIAKSICFDISQVLDKYFFETNEKSVPLSPSISIFNKESFNEDSFDIIIKSHN